MQYVIHALDGLANIYACAVDICLSLFVYKNIFECIYVYQYR